MPLVIFIVSIGLLSTVSFANATLPCPCVPHSCLFPYRFPSKPSNPVRSCLRRLATAICHTASCHTAILPHCIFRIADWEVVELARRTILVGWVILIPADKTILRILVRQPSSATHDALCTFPLSSTSHPLTSNSHPLTSGHPSPVDPSPVCALARSPCSSASYHCPYCSPPTRESSAIRPHEPTPMPTWAA